MSLFGAEMTAQQRLDTSLSFLQNMLKKLLNVEIRTRPRRS